LFDEVEEFVKDRGNMNLAMQSAMLTTTMLSLIQELRKKKNVIFIVATNYLNKFDEAGLTPANCTIEN
jgi:SpoVK/Ycf46/Vps4 family AAA+-type ATPase